jgi:hypothetical protein
LKGREKSGGKKQWSKEGRVPDACARLEWAESGGGGKGAT